MSAQPNGGGQQAQGPSGGGPNVLGWAVIVGVVLMMGFAIVMSVQRMQETSTVPGPTPTPKPRIGSIEVAEPDTAVTTASDEAATNPEESGGNVEVSAVDTPQADGEAGDVEVPATAGPESTIAEASDSPGGDASSEKMGTLRITEESPNTVDRELLVPVPLIVGVAPQAGLFAEVEPAPSATPIAADFEPATIAGDAATATSAFGRVRSRGNVTVTVRPDATPSATDRPASTGTQPLSDTSVPTIATQRPTTTPTVSSTDTIAPTDTPTATTTPTHTPTETATAVPSQTPTSTPTPTPTATATPTLTLTPTSTSTPTTSPTWTGTPVPTSTPVPTLTNTPEPTATPIPTEIATPVPTSTIPVEDLPVQMPPGSTVVAKFAALLVRLEPSPSAGVMETYAKDSQFDVLEPIDPFEPYPVTVGGINWLRVRADDGLVGWINASNVAPDE